MNSQYPKLLTNNPIQTERDLSTLRYAVIAERLWILRSIREPALAHQSRLRELILAAYRTLPVQPINHYDSILHLANQLNELAVSAQFVQWRLSSKETDISVVIKTFSDCLMNPWDPLSLWEDILIWRANLCTEVMKQGMREITSPSLTATYPTLLIARGARLQGLPEVALEYLIPLFSDTSNTYGEFDKWKEQAQISLDMNQHDPIIFTELDKLKVESLKDVQKAACQYIRGLYAVKEHQYEEAAAYFNNSVQTNPKYYKVWEAWSNLVYNQWEQKGDLRDAQQFLNCCFQLLAIKPDGTKVIPRFLVVLFATLDNTPIATTTTNYIQRILPSVWLPFLPFLLSFPTEAQFAIFQPVFKPLVLKYPQVMFYPLHTLCLNLGMPCNSLYAKPTGFYEGTIGSTLGTSDTTARPDTKIVSLSTVVARLNSLLFLPSHIPSQLLLFLDTLHATPHDPYRELIASIDQILRFAYSEVAAGGLQTLSNPVSVDLQRRLATLCSLSFNLDSALPSTFAFLSQFASAFNQDFNPSLSEDSSQINPSFPHSLNELLQRLLLWKDLALQHVQSITNETLFPQRFLPYIVEVPGLHIATHDQHQNFTAILNIHSYQPSLYVECHGCRHVEMIDEQGHSFRFYLEQVNSVDSIIEERTLYLQVFLDMLLGSSHVVQMRHFSVTLPTFVSLTPTLRLVRSSSHGVALEGVYREVVGKDYDEKQLEFALRVFHLNHKNQDIPSNLKDWLLDDDCDKVLSSMCSSDVLTRFL